MYIHVEFEFIRLRKRLATEFADTWPLFGMCSSDVAVMGCVGSEGFATKLALEGTLTTEKT